MYSSDTSPEAERVQVEILRGMSVAQRLGLVGALNHTARSLAIAGIRSRFPEATAAETEVELMALLLGRELASRVVELRRNQRPEKPGSPDARSTG